jgi:hypothetical protein
MLPEGDWNGPLAETSFATGVTGAGGVTVTVTGRLSREFSAMSVPLSMDVFVRPMTEGCRGGLGGILAHHEVPAS